jgi:hypothetical protein
VRRIDQAPFGWLDARLQHQKWLEVMSAQDLSVYVFLCLAADRQGVSWWRRDRIGRALGLDEQALHQALRRLYALDLVAFQPFSANAADGFHQVLSLPPAGPPEDPLALCAHLSERS